MKLFEALGLNWKILFAQLVNFAILIWVLHKFGYVPLIKFLEDRKKKIEKGIKNAELSKETLAQAGEKEKEIILKAKKEAQKIISSGEEIAKKNKEEIIKKAEEDAARIAQLAAEKNEQEKHKIIAEAKSEIANLVVLATEKIIHEKMDSEKDKELINQIIK